MLRAEPLPELKVGSVRVKSDGNYLRKTMRIVFRIEIEVDGDGLTVPKVALAVGSDDPVEATTAEPQSVPRQVGIPSDRTRSEHREGVDLIPEPNHRSEVEIAWVLDEAVQTGRIDPGTGKPVNPESAESIRRTIGVGKARARLLRDEFAGRRRGVAARTATDAELLERVKALQVAGGRPSVRKVAAEIGVGKDRAQRLLAALDATPV